VKLVKRGESGLVIRRKADSEDFAVNKGGGKKKNAVFSRGGQKRRESGGSVDEKV